MLLKGVWRYSTILALSLAGIGSFVTSSPVLGSIAHQTGSPVIISFQAMANSSTSVTFQASLSPNGGDTTYVFDYGLTTSYGQTTPTQDAGSGVTSVTVTAQATGLLPDTSYHYRIVATNSAGSMPSPDSTFITTSSSNHTVTTDGTTATGTTAARHPRKPKLQSTTASIVIEGTPVTTPAGGQSGLTGVSCVSTFCLAVGFEAPGSSLSTSGLSTPLVERWTGRSFVKFSAPPTPGASLYAIDCPSSAYCLAVGRDAPNAYSARWSGHRWQVLSTPSPATLNGDILTGLSCVSPMNCWSVGYTDGAAPGISALVEHWNGVAWSVIPVPSPHASLLNAVSCSSRADCWAVGSIDSFPGPGSALVEHWNGRGWSIASVPSGVGPLTSTSCRRRSMCWIDGSTSQSGVTLRFVDGLWKTFAVPRLFGGLGISCTAVRNCLNVGADDSGSSQPGEQWNGSSWNAVDAPGLPSGDIFHSVACISKGQCLMVGTNVGSTGTNYVAIGGVTRRA